MTYGMQCWNENGEKTFDSSVNTTRVLGSFNTGVNDGSKKISLQSGEKLWATLNYLVMPSQKINTDDLVRIPRVTVNNDIIYWNFDNFSIDSYFRNWLWSYGTKTISGNVIYGVYI